MKDETNLPTLLTAPELVVRQTSSFLSNDFALEDREGRVLGRVLTTGGASRLLVGHRTFDLVDEQGQLLLHIQDPFDLGLDRYELVLPDGSELAQVKKRFSLMSKQIDIQLPDLLLQLDGNLFDYNFEVRAGATLAARVQRQWGGLFSSLRGRSCYGLSFDPAAPAQVRLAILGGLVALDLIRDKKN